MTRARDLADSADKDIAGTVNLDAVNISGALDVDGATTTDGITNVGNFSTDSGTVVIDGNHPTGNRNLGIGNNTLSAIQSGATDNTVVGNFGGNSITTGVKNTSIGSTALDNCVDGKQNVGIGHNALTDVTSGDRNIGVGANAGASITTVDGIVAIGYQSLEDNTTGEKNVAVGFHAMRENIGGANNVAIGYEALRDSASQNNNVAIGQGVMKSSTGSSNTVAVGATAGFSLTTGDNNTFIGYGAGISMQTGADNTMIGSGPGLLMTSGSENVTVGTPLTGTTALSSTTAVGFNALAATTGNKNTAIGHSAGSAITSGVDNVIIGSYTGNSGGLDIRTSNNNIILSDGDANIRMRIDSSGNVGINNTSPQAPLHIIDGSGSVSGAAYRTLTPLVLENNGNTELQFFSNSSNDAQIRFGDGDSNFAGAIEYKHGSDTMLFYTAVTERMRINSSGNVGIGTASPSEPFHVSGTSGAVAVFERTDSASVGIRLLGNGMSAATAPKISAESGPDMAFTVNNAERMRIDSSGNVLVGVSSVQTQGGTTAGTSFYGGSNAGLITAGRNGDVLRLNRHSTDGDIAVFRKNGTTVGSIGTIGGDMVAGTGDTGLRFHDGADQVYPSNTNGSGRDAAIDLGNSGARFKDLYLSGGAYLGGTGAANKLDDYEEGTFTPTFARSGTAPVYGTSAANGHYTKIGNVVHIQILIVVNSVTTSGSGNLQVSGLPFSHGGSAYSGVLNVGYNDTFDAAIKDCYASGSSLQFIPTGITQTNYGGVLSTGYLGISGTYIST